MIDSSLSASILTVPISSNAHQQAQSLCRQQGDRHLAPQIYLNTLAVSAVNFYLQCMGFETRPCMDQSVNPVLLTMINTAALEVVPFGTVECRPVLLDQEAIHIPPEVWSDRLGYIAVQLDESLRSATLLGFISHVETQEVPLHQLKPIDDFMEDLHRLQSPQADSRTCLSQWLADRIDEGWRSLEALLHLTPNHLAVSLRTNAQVNDRTVKRAKLLDLGLTLDHQSLALLVAVMPNSQESLSPNSQEMLDILVQLHPSNGDLYLSPDVSICLMSATGERLQEVRSRQYDNYIQLKRFRGTSGECFDIQVSLDTTTLVERFII